VCLQRSTQFELLKGATMERKFNGSITETDQRSAVTRFARILAAVGLLPTLLGTLCSTPVWAQVTIAAGDIVVVDGNCCLLNQGAVFHVDPSTGAQTLISQGQNFNQPSALGIEASGTIAVANRGVTNIGPPAVIRVDTTKPSSSNQTIVHSGAPFVDVFGLALDANGNILVTDTGCPTHGCTTGHRVSGGSPAAIYSVNPTTGAVTTVTSGGFLDRPYGIKVELNGNLVVTDATSNVPPFTGSGGVIRIVIDPTTGSATQSVVSVGTAGIDGCPFGIALDAIGNILTSVFDSSSPYGCSPGAIFRDLFPTGPNTPFSPHTLVPWLIPFGMRVDRDNTILVVDESFKLVNRLNPDGTFLAHVSQMGLFLSPVDVDVYRSNSLPHMTSSADLSLTKSGSPNSVNVGAPLTYTLTIHNDGPDIAQNLTATDTLPAGVTFVSANGSGWTCKQSGGTVTCTLPSLANGAASAITINVNAPSQPGTINNSATITSSTNDPNSSNNTGKATTTVVAPPTEWNGHGVIAVSGGKAAFAFEVERESANGPVTGHLLFYHYVRRLFVQSISITSLVANGHTVAFTGTVKELTADGQLQGPYNFTVTAAENNDPARGRGNDTFRIQISDPGGTNEGGTLIRGRIEAED
jgi:uncharacterized repeat protein (TIGR01451 family)